MTAPRFGRGGLGAIVLLALTLGEAAAQPAPASGSRIVDYVAELRDAGIAVIYSDDLLTRDMRVEATPAGSTPLARLRSALAPHGLALMPGPRGTWLVVEAPPAAQPAPAPPSPSGSEPPTAPPIENIIVTASRYVFGRSTAPSTRRLLRAELETVPALGDDALRAMHGLPGISSGGLSARVNVRGGEADEALLLIDGVRLYNPFHLRDFQSLFSSISPRILESVEVRTGGYPVEFGDRMSAVVDMRTVVPSDARHHEVALSTLSSGVVSTGRFGDDRGEWLTSLRRGNLDLLADAANSDIGQPQYTDFFTRVSYALDPALRVGVGTLLLNDKISLRDTPFAVAGTDYDDAYFWLRLDHEPGTRFAATYLLSHTRLVSTRDGLIDQPGVSTGSLLDDRKFVVDALKADWSFELSDDSMLRWGAEIEDATADYGVTLSAAFPAPLDVEGAVGAGASVDTRLDLDGRQGVAYAAYRTRPLEAFTAELGLRWDAQSYLDDEQLSPRLHLLFDTGPRSTVRASWGRYFQAQGLDELQVADGLTTFFPAQEAEHLVLGFDYRLRGNAALRVEAYRKEFEQLRPRFENLFSRVALLPELLPDRVLIDPLRGEAAGVEIAFDGERGPWAWWVNVTRADVRDVLPEGRRRRRSWDESWSAKAGATWSGPRWTVTATGTAHAGWPIAELSLVDGDLVATERGAGRFPSFASLDVKATRRLALERLDMSWFVEVTNVLGRDNPCCIDYSVELDATGRPVRLEADPANWLPTVPSIGLMLEF